MRQHSTWEMYLYEFIDGVTSIDILSIRVYNNELLLFPFVYGFTTRNSEVSGREWIKIEWEGRGWEGGRVKIMGGRRKEKETAEQTEQGNGIERDRSRGGNWRECWGGSGKGGGRGGNRRKERGRKDGWMEEGGSRTVGKGRLSSPIFSSAFFNRFFNLVIKIIYTSKGHTWAKKKGCKKEEESERVMSRRLRARSVRGKYRAWHERV